MMRRQQSFQNDNATLFLVATPIGNLSEMTPRAIDILKSVDVIAAEDTRKTLGLLKHFQIMTKLIAHHKYNEVDSAKGLIQLLVQNQDIALVSDAGFPLICDPGYVIVKEVIAAGFNVVAVSGGNALLSGLVASGLSTSPFYFHGFLSHQTTSVRKELEQVKDYPMTLVYYEAVHRITKTLKLMLEVFGNRQICVARELTKLYEEYIRGSIAEVIEVVGECKGEFVIIVQGKIDNQLTVEMSQLHEIFDQYVQQGHSPSIAIKMVASEYQVSKNELYRYIHRS